MTEQHLEQLLSDSLYLEGVRLFNTAEFWHAHEAWETLWLASTGAQRQFVQGLIQVAAALVHWQRGNQRGLHLNWHKARVKLVTLPDQCGGIDLPGLITWMDAMDAQTCTSAPQLQLTELFT